MGIEEAVHVGVADHDEVAGQLEGHEVHAHLVVERGVDRDRLRRDCKLDDVQTLGLHHLGHHEVGRIEPRHATGDGRQVRGAGDVLLVGDDAVAVGVGRVKQRSDDAAGGDHVRAGESGELAVAAVEVAHGVVALLVAHVVADHHVLARGRAVHVGLVELVAQAHALGSDGRVGVRADGRASAAYLEDARLGGHLLVALVRGGEHGDLGPHG
mmetsp:Transcript_33330/g.78069  ORF Transcript_33330/g.78069 Transcript_33330/m.78069 type:complete len:212 (+) Transcript_33330:2350-2985(+)